MMNLLKYFQGRKDLKRILGNTGWLVSEKVLLLLIGLFVGIFVARHLGPEKYGVLNYASSVVSFLGMFVYLGLRGLVVRQLVKKPESQNVILGTTFMLKMIGAVVAFGLVAGTALLTLDTGGAEFWVMLIMGFTLLVKPFETVDFWFQSKILSKYTVYGKGTSAILSAAMRLGLVFVGASVIAFAVVAGLQAILIALLLVIFFTNKGGSILRWQFDCAVAWHLLRKSWIIIVSGFLSLINLRVDQMMLRWISGAEAVGIYAVAARFSEIWYFFPTALVMSAYPKLIEYRKSNYSTYSARLQQMFDLLFLMALCVAIAVSFLAGPLIPLLYGSSYMQASAILVIHVWGGIFMFMRALVSKWILIEDALYFSLASHGAGAVVNIVVNLILIPKYAGQGAAFATLMSYAASSYLILFIYSKSRPLAWQMTKSLCFPFRLMLRGSALWDTNQ